MKKKVFAVFFVIVMVVGVYGVYKPLPENISIEGDVHVLPKDNVHFFADRTYVDKEGERKKDHEIFDEKLRIINRAQNFIILDMFLYNDFFGSESGEHRPLSKELTEALIIKKKNNPEIQIHVITDPINTVYGSLDESFLNELIEAEIPVTFTDLNSLRDSNPLYSAWWRTALRYIPSVGGKFLPAPFEGSEEGITLPSYLKLVNFKANHRKVMIADFENEGGRGVSTFVTSANPHDASSAHSNTAFRVDGSVWKDAFKSEKAVVDFSGGELKKPKTDINSEVVEEGGLTVSVQILTERKIKDKTLENIEGLSEGDEISIVMFYLSDRDIIKALKSAVNRGVSVSLLLDSNKDAFGREKGGVPNRQVAYELMKKTEGDIEIRWCLTHGEQCHGKMLIFQKGSTVTIVQGSANLTRRNLNNLNLETDLLIKGNEDITAIRDALEFFDEVWNNEPEDRIYSVEYEVYESRKFTKRILYFLGEMLGMSTF